MSRRGSFHAETHQENRFEAKVSCVQQQHTVHTQR